ncbi:MAG TPA: hypothetical protein VFN70_18220 [Burkholderiales bacterium]|nr:hypothetical protein [Burkholderiales bacterium]
MSPARAAEMPPRYAALRVIHQVSSLRGGSNISIIEATGLRTIEAHGHPYPHFKVLPEGVEIPTTNVSSAIPAGSAQTLKLGRKERLRAREERIAAKLAAKAAAAPKQREGVEDIVDEDDTDFGDEVVEPGDSEVSE